MAVRLVVKKLTEAALLVVPVRITVRATLFDPSSIDEVAELNAKMAESLVAMVTVKLVDVVRVVLVEVRRRTKNVSFVSAIRSLTTATVIDLLVSPGAKARIPLVEMKSEVMAAVPLVVKYVTLMAVLVLPVRSTEMEIELVFSATVAAVDAKPTWLASSSVM